MDSSTSPGAENRNNPRIHPSLEWFADNNSPAPRSGCCAIEKTWKGDTISSQTTLLSRSVCTRASHSQCVLRIVFVRVCNCVALSGLTVSPFLLSHVRTVAQTAGQLEGKMDGDLGSLGQASITLDDISTILHEIFANPGRIADPGTKELVHEQRQFELVARLLLCAQRLYLVAKTWCCVQNSSELVRSCIESSADPYDFVMENPGKFPSFEYKPKVLGKSPFVSFVLKDIACAYSAERQVMQSEHAIWNELHRLAGSCTAAESNPDRMCFLLQALRALSELSPTGAGWTMTAQANWDSRFLLSTR